MKSILVLGAGRSSAALIAYLLDYGAKEKVRIVVGDLDKVAASQRIAGHPGGQAVSFNIDDDQSSASLIAEASIVVSLLPANFHTRVARICLDHQKHLVTASYVSDDMNALDAEARSKDVLLLNECGLDPGIDHMSAMQVIDRIRNDGGKLTSFESFTGGLIAPETDPQNPWRYKFTWNARNVVMAGQATAKFLKDGKEKFVPYQQLFLRTTRVNVPGYGAFEGYANRDSLKYIGTYGLAGIRTMIRGTLRYEGFCKAWNVLVQMGCCDDTYIMENTAGLTHAAFINAFLDGADPANTRKEIARQFYLDENGPEMTRLEWIGLFSDERVGLSSGSPATLLEHILNKRWKLQANDKDLIVMWHRFKYVHEGKERQTEAHLSAVGVDAMHTGMARTVGLPMGIAIKLVLEGKLTKRGVVIPVTKELYEPILRELATLGIQLTERTD